MVDWTEESEMSDNRLDQERERERICQKQQKISSKAREKKWLKRRERQQSEQRDCQAQVCKIARGARQDERQRGKAGEHEHLSRRDGKQ